MNYAIRLTALTALCATLTATSTFAQHSPVWFDSFDTSGNSLNINFENSTRQFGPLGIINYTANTADPANDWRHQLQAATSPGALQLAQAGNPSPTLASPLYNFSGLWGSDVLGTKISLTLDANTFVAPTHYSQAAITIGGSAPLLAAGTAGGGFSVMFVQDTFGGFGNTISIFDGSLILASLIANPAGSGLGAIELLISDTDGNPWDGIGGTTITLLVNSTLIGTWTKGAGGYSANYITLEGSQNFFGNDLATHAFDNLTVFVSPVPEPSTFALAGLGLAGLLIFRRRTA